MSRLPLLLTATALAATVLPAATASAGEPFTIGQGTDPHAVVDPHTGAARVVWADQDADKLRFCVVPRGATACTLSRTLDLPSGVSFAGTPFVLNGGGNVIHIAMAAQDKTYLYTSPTAGDTWNDGPKIYDAAPGTGDHEPAYSHTGLELVFPSGNPNVDVWSAHIHATEGAKTETATLPAGGVPSLVYDAQVAQAGGGHYVAVANNLQRTYLWKTTGANLDLSKEASWSNAPTDVGEGDTARLAGNFMGAYLMTSAGAPGSRRVEVRRYDVAAGAFGAPAVLAGEAGYVNDVGVSNAGGRVAAIWRKNDAPTHRLRFAISADQGATWTTSTIARESAVMASMDVAISEDGQGFAVYEGESVDGDTRHIRLATTDPLPEPPAPPAPGGGSSTTVTTTPNPILNAIGGGAKTAPKGTSAASAKVKRTTATVPGAKLTLSVPSGCIPAGKPFTATLAFAKQRRKGNVFVKVRRTDFSIGGKTLKKDTSAPFTQTLTIPNPKQGRTYTLKARAHIKVKRGAGPKKSIAATLRVCA